MLDNKTSMSISNYNGRLTPGNIWLFPVCFMLLAFCFHLWTDAIRWPVENEAQQRDMNTAIAMTLLTGVFWAGVRAVHQNIASTLLHILTLQKQSGEFEHHRITLSRKFVSQLLVVGFIAPLMPLFYIISEGLFTRMDEAAVFGITLVAIPFWLFFLLFITQVTTNTNYVFSVAFKGSRQAPEDVPIYNAVFDMALRNTHFALIVIAIIPIFWFNRTITPLDSMLVVMTAGVLVLYLFIPVIRSYVKIRALGRLARAAIDEKVNTLIRHEGQGFSASKRLELLQCQREQTKHVIKRRQKRTLVFSLSLLPLSLFLIFLLEKLG
ncbi:hypothetical protein [Alteromonas sp. CYL-A6]|uniref:hypothetical protein n=1 Tax=Alteromonas nitratireducens TaxID=3390813 RepID=UPI0034B33402